MLNNNATAFRANRIFVDRIEPTALVNSSCKDILDRKYDKKMYVFYGYGGIGKSKFLSELQRNVIYKDAFYTESVVLFDNVVLGQDSVDFTFLWN